MAIQVLHLTVTTALLLIMVVVHMKHLCHIYAWVSCAVSHALGVSKTSTLHSEGLLNRIQDTHNAFHALFEGSLPRYLISTANNISPLFAFPALTLFFCSLTSLDTPVIV